MQGNMKETPSLEKMPSLAVAKSRSGSGPVGRELRIRCAIAADGVSIPLQQRGIRVSRGSSPELSKRLPKSLDALIEPVIEKRGTVR